MSEDTVEVTAKAETMFSEISRILKMNGKYICITLAEPYILKTLINNYSKINWDITVESIKSKKASPFLPFFIILTKRSESVSSCLTLSIDSFGTELEKVCLLFSRFVSASL
jgi:ubiquinone/menaquinone biosynthesis C-methylase UbiE